MSAAIIAVFIVVLVVAVGDRDGCGKTRR